ncbi:tyrosine-protein phosphatase [Mangrovimicrobium sediminis]|nr:tyrosine-protein phosphatase [Haliea sp. SAOS-164]
MSRKTLYWSALAFAAVAIALVQFIPAPPLQVPAQLPAEERAQHRMLNFEGVRNFRDLGGYPTADGRHVRWGVLYRAGSLDETSRADQQGLARLDLYALVDFRSAPEKEEAPDQLPPEPAFKVVEIPILDEGNNALDEKFREASETGDFSALDPDALMTDAYRDFATVFSPEFASFFDLLLEADGRPVLWHCTAGKDRTGFSSAVLLRLLGVPEDVIYRDYMASGDQAIEARSATLSLLRMTRGDEAADKVKTLLGVEEHWLRASFAAIDERYGSFDNYLQQALGLDAAKQARLRERLLE